MNTIINKIISKFGSNYTKIGAGVTYPCPFHGGKKLGHFNINSNNGVYHCFVCGVKGSVLTNEEIKGLKINNIEVKTETETFISLKSNDLGFKFFTYYLDKRNIWYDFEDFSFVNNLCYTPLKYTYSIGLIISQHSNYMYNINYDHSKNSKMWKKVVKVIYLLLLTKTLKKLDVFIYLKV